MSSQQDRSVVLAQQKSDALALDRAEIVIIGNGIAGLTAAVEARRLAPDKRIVIITEQLHPTINTPALKQYAIARLSREQLLAYPAGTERAERIHVVNAHVEEIHAQSKYVSLNGNRGFGYNSLLVATGSSPMGLPERTPGRGFDGVITLHRLQDYLDFRRRIPEVREAVVVGGGVHANETVMGLLHWGIRVHWLIRGKTFLPRMLDSVASEMVLNNVRRAGAIVHTETEVAGVIGRVGAVAGIITNAQEMIPCQLVLTCTGTQAALSLAEHCSVPMRHKQGILVDDHLRTSVRDIYAAGDVAALRNPQNGKYETRAQWYAAVTQGRIAGAMMVGHEELAREPIGVHWHATHVGALSMYSVGEPLSSDPQVSMLTDSSQGNYRRIAVMGDRLVGYLSLGMAQPDSLAIKRIIDEGHSITEVIRALLKGNFDAREFLSHRSSQRARGILSGKLPPLEQPLRVAERSTRRLPDTGPIAPRPASTRLLEEPQRILPAPAAVQRAAELAKFQPAIYEEELSPFAGNLPTYSPPERAIPSRRPVAQNVPRYQASDSLVDEFNPFAGSLYEPQIVESTVAFVEPAARKSTRNLWEYTDGRSVPAARRSAGRIERGLRDA